MTKALWLDRMTLWWAIAGGVFVLAVVFVTTANVVLFGLDRAVRPFGGVVSGLPGYEDFVGLAVSGAALMFFPLCQLRRGHVVVDVFTDRLPLPWRQAIDRIWAALACLVALFLAYWLLLGLDQVRTDGGVSPVLGWPLWPFYAPGVVSMLLWALVAARQAAGRQAHGHP